MTTDADLNLFDSLTRSNAKLRRRAIVGAWGAVLLAFVIVLALVAGATRDLARIQKSRVEAEGAQREAEAKRDKALGEQAELLKANQRLSQKNREVSQEKDTAISVRDALNSVVAELPKEAVAMAVDKVEARAPDAHAPTKLPPRVYVQIVRADDRARATEVGKRIQNGGFVVLGVEYVPKGSAPYTMVKYYKDTEREVAEALRRSLLKAGVKDATLVPLHMNNSTAVRPLHFEVWFAPHFELSEPQTNR